MDKSNKTAVVTGANSGLGFEAAAQLAADGWLGAATSGPSSPDEV
jgi:NAD(P)-dependent dehydrogenase (short-subunit alcohol dehydrogenase family)